MSEEEEFIALRNTILYKYYKDYVEPLEKEYDDIKDKSIYLQNENKRLREQNVMLHKKIRNMDLVIKKLRG